MLTIGNRSRTRQQPAQRKRKTKGRNHDRTRSQGSGAGVSERKGRPVWNALHAWANSPDWADALAEFKARVKAAIEKALCNLRRQSQCNPQHTVHITCIEEHVAPILSECEPPAPPQPKFAVGQVLRTVKTGAFCLVSRTRVREGIVEYDPGQWHYLGGWWWPESDLRPLTPEEKG